MQFAGSRPKLLSQKVFWAAVGSAEDGVNTEHTKVLFTSSDPVASVRREECDQLCFSQRDFGSVGRSHWVEVAPSIAGSSSNGCSSTS